MNQAKSFPITKRQVWEAYLQVKNSKGGPGYDKESMEKFESNLKDNLYKIWNRLASGSYFPPPVLKVEIPKADGGTRSLGIPTVGDRIAQATVRNYLEPIVESTFHEDSYGYRPNKSALQALAKARSRCWRDDWVLDVDIKSFFDSIDHQLMLAAVKKYTQCPWVMLYVERWLKADVINQNGERQMRNIGTPQGGVISPLLSNIFLHLVFDNWMKENYPCIQFERYADDILIHCRSKQQLDMIRRKLEKRFAIFRLSLSKEKTKEVYCKDTNRQENQACTSFTFLGYTFRPRYVKSKDKIYFVSFCPAISPKAAKRIRQTIKRKWKMKMRIHLDLAGMADCFNPAIQGWINYYGKFHGSALYSIFDYINTALIRWAMQKYKNFRRHFTNTGLWLKERQNKHPNLFVHWRFKANKMVG